MNARVTVPTQTSRLFFGLIVFILLLSVLVISMKHANLSIFMPSVLHDSGPVSISAGQAEPHVVPVPTPPASTAQRPAAATPVPASNQPAPVPQPVPTPPSGR